MNWFNYLEIIFSQHIAVILKMLLSRNILRFCPKLELMSCSQYRFKSVKSMKQVDVDDLELQAHLGKLLTYTGVLGLTLKDAGGGSKFPYGLSIGCHYSKDHD